MARQIFRLSDTKIRSLRKKGLHADGQSLYLRITESGSKSWIFRFMLGGRRRDMGLGHYPSITLSEARELAREAHAAIQRGIDPVEARRERIAGARPQPKITTFQEAADLYIAAHECSWKNEKHRWQWRQTINDYAGPALGHLGVAAVSTHDVLKAIEPLWREKPETASRLRGRIEAVLGWAAARGLRSGENPARWRGHIGKLLPARAKVQKVQHHPALPWREVPDFVRELREIETISARALEFTMLTAARTGEVIGATWREIDRRNKSWLIPDDRMKAGVAHRIPLSAAAIALLDDLARLEDNPHIFPGARRAHGLSNMTMLKLLRQLRPGLTVHGFRSSFRVWAAEATNFPREIAEMCLAHQVGNAAERAYQRADLLEKRRKLMDAWAEYCGRDTRGRIVPMHARIAP
jgi:integrase